MNDVISNILDIENKANSIIEEGKEEKKSLETQMKSDVAKIQKDINDMVEIKLEQLDDNEKKTAKQNLERINKTADERLIAMEAFSKENRDFWVQSVFEIITGSEKSGS